MSLLLTPAQRLLELDLLVRARAGFMNCAVHRDGGAGLNVSTHFSARVHLNDEAVLQRSCLEHSSSAWCGQRRTGDILL